MEQAERELTVRLERQIKAAPARVWRVISSIEGMGKWLGPRTFEPQHNGRVLFDVQHSESRWIMYGRVTRFEPDKALAFTWQELDEAQGRVWPVPTLLTVALEANAEGTLVRLSHSGFEALPDGAEQFKGYQEGWAGLNDLDQLAAMCETEE